VAAFYFVSRCGPDKLYDSNTDSSNKKGELRAGMKKVFPCGHRGKGKYCHRCAEEQRQQADRDRHKNAVAAAPIELGHVPDYVQRKALQYIASLEQGDPYEQFRGKRLTHLNREIISIPLPGDYRLIYREKDATLIPLEVITHETYNRRLSTNIWPQ
jgi:hypothetical protein